MYVCVYSVYADATSRRTPTETTLVDAVVISRVASFIPPLAVQCPSYYHNTTSHTYTNVHIFYTRIHTPTPSAYSLDL